MYSAGFLNEKVSVLNRGAHVETAFGRESGAYAKVGEYWCNWKWTKGAQAMREGALDAYDTIMVRMRWHANVTRDSLLEKDGKQYQITSLNGSKRADEMQIVCVEIQ